MIRFTDHTKTRLEERDISEQQVIETLTKPDLVLPARSNRKMAIKKINQRFLKVVYVEDKSDIIVITAHWMSKVKGLNL